MSLFTKFPSCELNFFLYILPEMKGKSFETYHMTVRLQLIGKTENFACDGATLSNSVNQFSFAVINFCTFADGSQLCGWKISHLIQVIIFLCRFIFRDIFLLAKASKLIRGQNNNRSPTELKLCNTSLESSDQFAFSEILIFTFFQLFKVTSKSHWHTQIDRSLIVVTQRSAWQQHLNQQ